MAKVSIDTTGKAAKSWHEEISKATKKAQDYNEVRRDRTKKLRTALTKVWAALETGETVNGFTGKEAWARWFNDTVRTKNPIRQIQRIIAGPKPKATSVRLIKVRDDETFILDVQHPNFGNVKISVQMTPDGPAISKTPTGDFRVTFVGKPVEPEKEKERAVAAEDDISSPQPKSETPIARGLRLHAEQKEQKKKDRAPKTHKMRPAPSEKMTWCGKLSGTHAVAQDGEEPTCVACQQREFMTGQRKWAEEFEKLAPAGLSKKESLRLWTDFCQAKHGYVRGKNGDGWVPDEAGAQQVLLVIAERNCPTEEAL